MPLISILNETRVRKQANGARTSRSPDCLTILLTFASLTRPSTARVRSSSEIPELVSTRSTALIRRICRVFPIPMPRATNRMNNRARLEQRQQRWHTIKIGITILGFSLGPARACNVVLQHGGSRVLITFNCEVRHPINPRQSVIGIEIAAKDSVKKLDLSA